MIEDLGDDMPITRFRFRSSNRDGDPPDVSKKPSIKSTTTREPA
jgi:hypothetical protein